MRSFLGKVPEVTQEVAKLGFDPRPSGLKPVFFVCSLRNDFFNTPVPISACFPPFSQRLPCVRLPEAPFLTRVVSPSLGPHTVDDFGKD